MRSLGEQLSHQLQPGDIIVLHGPLGAGKTALTQGIGYGLGIRDITSPTFVISRVHQGRVRLNHVDVYRLLGAQQSAFEFDDLDIDIENAITVIEWGSGIVDRLHTDYLLVEFEFGSDENQRIVNVVGHGKRWQGFQL
jgi:tRNA threonylcarbamoyladenosine biosynthesis protein TsaE